MTDPVAAPAAAHAPSGSLAGDALFAPAAAAPAAAPAADPAAPAAALTPEQQAAADAAKAAEPVTLKMPGKDATPEEWAAFYKQAGAPEKAEDYQVALPEGDDPENAARIQALFKEANLLPEQAAKLLEVRNKLFAESNAAAAKAQADADAAMDAKNKQEAADLANEWGAKQTENMEMVRRGATQFIEGGPERQYKVIAAMEKELGYKDTMKFFQSIGQRIAEHDAAGLGSNNGQGAAPKTMAERIYGKA
jgi:hypothetical protein